MSTHSAYMGKAQAFSSLGFSPEQIKVAFIHEGLPEDYADTLCKVAIWGRVAGAAAKGLGMASKALGRGAGASAKWGAQGIRRGGILGKAQGRAGLLAGRSAKGLQGTVRGMATAPGQTMWQGAKNLGAGALLMQGKGVAGTVGKASYVNSMVG